MKDTTHLETILVSYKFLNYINYIPRTLSLSLGRICRIVLITFSMCFAIILFQAINMFPRLFPEKIFKAGIGMYSAT